MIVHSEGGPLNLSEGAFSFAKVTLEKSKLGDRWVASPEALELPDTKAVTNFTSKLRLFDEMFDAGRVSDCESLVLNIQETLPGVVGQLEDKHASTLRGLSRLRMADLFVLKKMHSLADEHYKLAGELLKDSYSNAPLLKGRILLHRSEVSASQGSEQHAEFLLSAAIPELERADPIHRLLGFALVKLGTLQNDRGSTAIAAKNIRRGMTILGEQGYDVESSIQPPTEREDKFTDDPLQVHLKNIPDPERGKFEEVQEWYYQLMQLCTDCFEAGEVKAAKAALSKAIPVASEFERGILGEESILVAKTVGLLGTAQRLLGEDDAAQKSYEDALEIFCTMHPENLLEQQIVLIDRAVIVNELGILKENAGDLKGAYRNYCNVVEMMEDYEILEPYYLTALEGAGRVAEKLGDSDAAQDFNEKAERVRDRLGLDEDGEY